MPGARRRRTGTLHSRRSPPAITTGSARGSISSRPPAIRARPTYSARCRPANCMSARDRRCSSKPRRGVVAADTGAPATDVPATALKPVRVNNPVRNAIAAALGGLRLFSPDPALRLEAAEAVFQSHDPESLPALDRALAKETDPAVKERLQQARAASAAFRTGCLGRGPDRGDRGAARARRSRRARPAREHRRRSRSRRLSRRCRAPPSPRSIAGCSSGASPRISITG